LLEQGQARVSARVGNKACADALLVAERAARATSRGLWANPNFALLNPDNRARLQAERGRFTIIEGKVLSVRESGSTIYVNFGPRWTQDFSVIILRRNQRIFKDAGLEPKRLEGRRIRVRGIIEQRRGPVIEADRPEQIEFADETMTKTRETRQ
jgi:DNA/RNA endonuclease YhcR with UshA esterase domain